MHSNRAGGIPWVRLCGACLVHGIAPRFCVRTGAYPYGNVAAYVTKRQATEKGPNRVS